MKSMYKIMMICHGNICRSTMAEMVLKDMVRKRGLEDQFHIDSAATSREEIGNGVHHGTRRKLAEVGIPCDDHRAKQVTMKDYEEFDYLILMDENNMRNIKRIIPTDPDGKISKLLQWAGSEESIADPWYTGNFDETYDDVVRGCEGLLKHILG